MWEFLYYFTSLSEQDKFIYILQLNTFYPFLLKNLEPKKT